MTIGGRIAPMIAVNSWIVRYCVRVHVSILALLDSALKLVLKVLYPLRSFMLSLHTVF